MINENITEALGKCRKKWFTLFYTVTTTSYHEIIKNTVTCLDNAARKYKKVLSLINIKYNALENNLSNTTVSVNATRRIPDEKEP